jgi:hypothetical protein
LLTARAETLTPTMGIAMVTATTMDTGIPITDRITKRDWRSR